MAKGEGNVDVLEKSTSIALDINGKPKKTKDRLIPSQLRTSTRTINKDGIEMFREDETQDRNIDMEMDIEQDLELDKAYFILQTETIRRIRENLGIAYLTVARHNPFRNIDNNYVFSGKTRLYGEYMDTLAIHEEEIEKMKKAYKKDGTLTKYQKNSDPDLYYYGVEGHQKETDKVNESIMKQIKYSKTKGSPNNGWKIKSALEEMAQREGIAPKEQQMEAEK